MKFKIKISQCSVASAFVFFFTLWGCNPENSHNKQQIATSLNMPVTQTNSGNQTQITNSQTQNSVGGPVVSGSNNRLDQSNHSSNQTNNQINHVTN